MRWTLMALTLFAAAPAAAQQDAEDRAAIRAAAEDYINGFMTGDSARMRRALHPDLAKRQATGAPGAPSNQTADDLVGITARVAGRGGVLVPADSIRIVDRYRDIAMVRIGAPTWVDYLHVARFGTEWRIINVLWEMRPR